MKENRQVTKIDLSVNDIGDGGAEAGAFNCHIFFSFGRLAAGFGKRNRKRRELLLAGFGGNAPPEPHDQID